MAGGLLNGPIRGRQALWLSEGATQPPVLEAPWTLRPRALEEGPFHLDELLGVGAVLCRDGPADSARLREALALLLDRGAPLLAWGDGARALAGGEAAGEGGSSGPGPVELTPEGVSDPLFQGLPRRWRAELGRPFGAPLSRESVPLARGPHGDPAALRQWGLPAYALRFEPGPLLSRFLALYTEAT